MPERRLELQPLRCWCSPPPFDLLGQLGADRYVGRL